MAGADSTLTTRTILAWSGLWAKTAAEHDRHKKTTERNDETECTTGFLHTIWEVNYYALNRIRQRSIGDLQEPVGNGRKFGFYEIPGQTRGGKIPCQTQNLVSADRDD